MSLVSASFDVPDMGDYARDWALVDVETSGLMARRDRVLSVAVITIGPDGEQTGEFSTLLNPGCDPGPVQVHGLTVERLRGAPTFDQVAGRIGAMLQERVLVAHNAQFDYDFLAYEFARARMWLPVSQRLCTLALNRQVDPPTDDMKLGTLAAHYGVPQQHAHDALDDTRVLAGILRASLREAARLDLPLPLVTCPPRAESQFTPQPPKTPCAYRNPGRLTPGEPLQQGMKVAITGETAHARAELVGRAVAAGLNMMTSVSRHTSVLVTNEPASGSAKARRALAEGVPLIDEHTFVRMLTDVRPGTAHEATAVAVAPPAEPEAEPVVGPVLSAPTTTSAAPVREAAALTPAAPGAGVPAPRQPVPSVGTSDKPLAGRRVLVLGGVHADAAAARTRIVELGGSAAVNLSASVTDVVLLEGGQGDRRMSRITALELPVHDLHWLTSPTATAPAAAALRPQEPHVMPRGGVIDLPMPHSRPSPEWYVTAGWAPQADYEIDVVAFLLDEDEQVTFDEDFIFYGAPESPAGTVRLLTGGPAEQTIALNLASLPPATRKVVIAAAIDGAATFGTVGAIQIGAAPGSSGAPLARATLDAATTERTMLLAEIYRRGPVWRLRAVGQGYDHGLDALARGYGVDIAD
ncbi:DNA polymerase III [Streptomyces cyaneochromogenes]|uniref:DNA polymerase III n=1 Tax=Streptomyces cyaneochromogenes TaxID=2496836 RepID=A0A3S9MJB3_9ACTN|nr:TerD family protein [Streptomyces cyaneochromogenes]AZQ39259.1 DNA polymerase III [Streptomyces cyaneochromogenes]